MSAYKDGKKGTWYVQLSYKDWTGKYKHTCKRGFTTKREAQKREQDFMDKLSGASDMNFVAFAELYLENLKARIKESTFSTKENIIRNRIVPYFGQKKLNEITSQDVIKWQNETMKIIDKKSGKPFTKSYLKTIHNQLSAMLNHAIKYYGLQSNPAATVGNMGTDKEVEIQFWTIDQYKKFSEEMLCEPIYFACFEILYWCGIREGELLALTPKDLDFENKTISINKTFHHLNGRDYVTDPKTRKSRRKVKMPNFLCEELKEYMRLFRSLP